MKKVIPVTESGCWIFTGALDTAGYGLIGVGGSGNVGKAHRVLFEISNGPIPNDMQVLHRCDVRCCVNPDHLFIGTLNDNMADRNAKGRQAKPKGELHNMHKLTDDDVRAIREEYAAGGISQRALAAKYGVTKYPIQRILNGTGWTHIK